MRGLAVLALVMVVGSQEGEEADPARRCPALSETRTHLRLQLERILLDRYLLPFDAWLEIRGYESLRKAEEPVWYALVITDQPHKGPPVWLKFSLDPRKGYSRCMGCERCWAGRAKPCSGTWNPGPWIRRKREMLALSLEQHFIRLMNDTETLETIRYGKAHFYRIPSRESDVTTLRPRKAIY